MENTPESRMFLIILDGWGHRPDPSVSAIARAHTPYMDSIYKAYPNAELVTHGMQVGLPDGQMGNSEVGHLNIGAGRIVYQELARINKAIEDQEFHQNPVLLDALDKAKASGSQVHLLGLVSDGGVHSHINHLKALCDIINHKGLEKAFIHAFTDGRDVDPYSGLGFIREIEEHIQSSPIEVASVVGRYYAMDRDKRWERVRLAYDLLTRGEGIRAQDVPDAIQKSYDAGITDEFIKPIVHVDDAGHPLTTIRDGDLVIFFNFRTDRPRQLTKVLSQEDMPEYDMHALDLEYITMTEYDSTFKGIRILFRNEPVRNTLGEYLSALGKTQLRIAETEKYPHVTYFFSGGAEAPFKGENRILIPSPKVATYDLQPEMSAHGVTQHVLDAINQDLPDFICLNFANTDMVGHTGVFEAAVKAAEAVDACMRKIVPVALEKGYGLIIIADHGNSDTMINPDGSVNTAHTKNPVPVIYVSNHRPHGKVLDGKLADIAPSILSLMGIEIPPEMTGEVIVHRMAGGTD